MSAPTLVLGLAAGLLGYWIASRVGAFGLLKLGGEGDSMDANHGGDPVDPGEVNSGEPAPPSPSRKRLFVAGRYVPRKRPLHVVTLYGADYVSTDSGLPVDIAKYIDGGTA